MRKLLAVFWLRRFVGVLALVALGLLALDFARHGQVAELGSVVGWGVGTAVLAASVSTYWAYRIRCRVVMDERDG